MKHQSDTAFRSLVLNGVSEEPRTLLDVVTDLIDRQGYKATVADVQCIKNGKNLTSVFVHRAHEQLKYLVENGTIQLEKIKGKKHYRR